jgi:hypothetical protein
MSKPNDAATFWQKVDRVSGQPCWLWTAWRNSSGYGCVLHHCDTPACCNPNHLWLGTYKDNALDMCRKGRQATGDAHGSKTHPERWSRGSANGTHTHPERVPRGEARVNAKLTEAQVKEIRSASGLNREIAAKYGVSEPLISRIRSGIRWQHVE